MKLGIMSGVYRRHSVREAARRVKAAGFRGVQLDLDFADLEPGGEAPGRVREAFGEEGLTIAGLSGYTNWYALIW